MYRMDSVSTCIGTHMYRMESVSTCIGRADAQINELKAFSMRPWRIRHSSQTLMSHQLALRSSSRCRYHEAMAHSPHIPNPHAPPKQFETRNSSLCDASFAAPFAIDDLREVPSEGIPSNGTVDGKTNELNAFSMRPWRIRHSSQTLMSHQLALRSSSRCRYHEAMAHSPHIPNPHAPPKQFETRNSSLCDASFAAPFAIDDLREVPSEGISTRSARAHTHTHTHVHTQQCKHAFSVARLFNMYLVAPCGRSVS